MALRFMADGQSGRVAVMANATPSDPWSDPSFTNPSAHLGDSKFHSGNYHLGYTKTLSGSVNLRNTSPGWIDTSGQTGAATKKISIAAHGLGFAPIILGYFTIDGHQVPINGSTLVLSSSGGTPTAIDAYADTSNVYIRQTALTNFLMGYDGSNRTISYTIHVCNIGISGSSLVLPPYFNGLDASSTTFKAGYFDPQNYGYFYKDDAGSIIVYRGPSLSVDVGSFPSSSSYFMLGARQDINGYSLAAVRTNAAHDTSPWNRNWPGTPALYPSIYRISITPKGSVRGIDAGSGRIRLGTGFDTNQNSLIISNLLQPTINIPQFSTSGSGIYRTDYFNLGSCNPNATLPLGIFSKGGEVSPVGGTTFLRASAVRMGPSQSYTINASGSSLPAVGQTISFEISSGQVIATVRSFMPRGLTANFPASTLVCKIFAGTFDY